jgi:hypothetical protein
MAGSDGGVTPGHSYLNTAGSRKGSASMLAQLGTASLPSRKGSMEEVKMAAGVQLTQAELAASEQLPAPEAPLISDLEAFLAESADAWTFDAFRLEELSGGHALSVLGYYLLHKTGLLEAHKIRGIKAARLMRAIESGYQPNPYHNKTHAADVLQTMHVLLLRSGMVGAYADPLTHLACLLAASGKLRQTRLCFLCHACHAEPKVQGQCLVMAIHAAACGPNTHARVSSFHGDCHACYSHALSV